MKVIFLDNEKKCIRIYGETGIQELPFEFADELEDILEHRPALYVTKAITVHAGQVLDLVNNLMPQEQYVPTEFASVGQVDNPNVYFLRSTSNGPVFVEGLNFYGPGDCKTIDENLLAILKGSVSLQALLKRGQIEIVDKQTMEKLSRKHGREQQVKAAQVQEARDQDLDSIIVKDKTVAEMRDSAEDMFDGSSDIDLGGPSAPEVEAES